MIAYTVGYVWTYCLLFPDYTTSTLPVNSAFKQTRHFLPPIFHHLPNKRPVSPGIASIASRCWPLTSSRFPTKWRPPPTPPREHNASLDEACLGVRDEFEVAGLPMEDHIDDQKRFFLKKELNCMIRFWYHVFFYMMNSGFWCQVEQWLWIINLWFFCFSGCLWKRDLFCEWNNPSFDRSSQAATLLIHPETTNVNVRRFSIA